MDSPRPGREDARLEETRVQHRPATIVDVKTPGQLALGRDPALVVDMVTLARETVVPDVAIAAQGSPSLGHAMTSGVARGRS